MKHRFNFLRIWLAAVACLATLSAAAQAPAYEWATACGSGPDPSGLRGNNWGPKKIVVDAQGYTYVAGTFNDTTVIGNAVFTAVPGTASYSVGDAFVAKLDPQGNYLWAASAGSDHSDVILDLALDARGDVYVAGDFRGFRLAFGAGGPVLYNSSAFTDAFVAKLSGATGQWQWARRAGGTGYDGAKGLAVNAQGEVSIVGVFVGVADFGPTTLTSAGCYDLFVARLSSVGAWLWARAGGGSACDWPSSIVTDGTGAVYIAGAFSGYLTATTSYSSTTLQASRVQGAGSDALDVFVTKLDAAGNWAWAVQGDGVAGQNLLGRLGGVLATDGAGGLYLAGSYGNQSVRLGPFVLPNLSQLAPLPVPPQPNPYTVRNYFDAYVARLDAATGAWQWAVRTGDGQPDEVQRVLADVRGRVVVTGDFANPVPGGPARVTAAQLDGATGTWQGAWQWPAAAAAATALALDGQGRLHVGNDFSTASATLGNLTVAGAGPGMNTGYVARLGAGLLGGGRAAAERAGPALQVWPNPANGREVWVQGARAGQPVTVLDVLGRVVGTERMPASGPLHLHLPAGLPAGLYMVRGLAQSQQVVLL